MLSQIVLVGRIENIEKRDNETIILLKVPRKFKNEKGEYESDLIRCNLPKNIAVSVNQYCSTNDIVGVKGRIANNNGVLVIIAEKVTFLSSNNAKE